LLGLNRGADTYGRGAVEKLAKALGRDADTLYDCAHVFVLLENKKLGALAERSDHGLPLSFSHWVVIANACPGALKSGDDAANKKTHHDDVEKGEGLAKKALKKGWSVRTLKEAAMHRFVGR
jgi:hypothetical protein